jgi:pyruvate dehydrogenase E2 component (dihydrolipoamide acetyltransferase)
VRRLARELGIDVNDVPGTGPDGRISLEDVKAYARQILSGAAPTLEDRGAPRISNAPAAAFSIPDLPDFSRFGEVERVTTNKVRKVTAETMALSWNVIPHVTQFDRADITELEPWRARYAPRVEAAGGKLTVTAIAVKVVASALKVFPKFNASYDHREQELVLKKYINVGVAVDTDHGLLVPVIRDADRKNITTIAAELAELSEKSRTRKIALDDLQGANFNISNLGGLGTTYFSPIVAWPQVAVLGMGRANVEAVHRDGAFVPRSILPLAVSYDHRAVDGADCARFLRWIAEAMEQPLLLALEG